MFGIDWGNSQTLWLNLTNLALGLVTLLGLLVVAGGIAQELVAKRRTQEAVRSKGGHLRRRRARGPLQRAQH